ncbi:asparagine synthase-related protein [Colwellia psychrerythraea]|uniref:asparagine synthase (glutamine-hydrolyzing) n=1 Tax=Colwellia psychrerythraea (strain 34H / ATCC BAA-681) TaxID=167879 RepID=Q489C7_COLP3|nr:asparagine synthase-related protein [Colwellia psychrerythraea]AAZ26171.1 hypothetical protein CPS_0587 [Colwellia psychrerythraea 34H]
MEFYGPITGEKFAFLLFRDNGEVIEFNHWSQVKEYKSELKISKSSIQIFLRNGCVYPPYTIYSNVLMLPIGTKLTIDIKNDIFKWENNFCFLDRHSKQDSKPSTSKLKTLIANSFAHLKKEVKPIYMMQSAGKDSTAMLLGLHEQGIQNVHCVTYEANFRDTESDAAKKIAESLGFEHTILFPNYEAEFDALLEYQENAVSITGDFSMLPYIAANKSVFKSDSLVIDGLGNDLYMGYVSNKLERSIMKCSLGNFSYLEPSKFTSNEVINYAISSIFMKPYERLFPGTRLSSSEIENFTDNKFIDDDAIYFSKQYNNLDKDDFRAAIRARFCDSTMFQMKAELTTNSFGNEVYFPFSNKELVDYYFNLPIEERYDKANSCNKTLLRSMLNEYVEVDDFFKVKSGFRYNMPEFITINKEKIKKEIIECDLLEQDYSNRFFAKHLDVQKVNYTSACKAYILLVFASWRNRNKLAVVDGHVADKFDWY